MKSSFVVMDNVPKKFRIEITVDTENKIVDAQLFDACETLRPGQEVVTGCDELNEKLAEGWRLVEILRPRTRPLKFLVERCIEVQKIK